eukprot:COSAG01_NODE_8193_length_2882_cov_3.418972_4_plen_442_part_00
MTDVAALDAAQEDGRPLYAHVCMAVMEKQTGRLAALVDALTEEDTAALLFFNGWPGPSTLMMLACSTGNTAAARYLHSKGADVNDCGADSDEEEPEHPDASPRMTPLHLAAGGGDTTGELVKWLVQEAGADVKALDRNGCTAFLVACVRGQLAAVRFFVQQAGCDINMRDGSADRRTGLRWALEGRHWELAGWMIRNGASTDCLDARGKTALQVIADGRPDEANPAWLTVAGLLATTPDSAAAADTLASTENPTPPPAPAPAPATKGAAKRGAKASTGLCRCCFAAGATLRCGRCQAVCYCSKDCQKKHWKGRGVCAPNGCREAPHKEWCVAPAQVGATAGQLVAAIGSCRTSTALQNRCGGPDATLDAISAVALRHNEAVWEAAVQRGLHAALVGAFQAEAAYYHTRGEPLWPTDAGCLSVLHFVCNHLPHIFIRTGTLD